MARYLPDSGLLIQHIPRTGGTWVEKALDQLPMKKVKWVEKQPDWIPKKHALLSHYFRDQLACVKYVAAFVRCPVPYYSSVWRWLVDSERRKQELRPGRSSAEITIHSRSWHPHRTATIQWLEAGGLEGTFNDWVYLMLEKEPMWYTRLLEQYVGPPGGEFCDFIGRTENLTSDLILLLETLGYRFDVAMVTSTSRANQSKEPLGDIDKSLISRIEDTEFQVIERFYKGSIRENFYARLAQEGPPTLVDGGRQT